MAAVASPSRITPTAPIPWISRPKKGAARSTPSPCAAALTPITVASKPSAASTSESSGKERASEAPTIAALAISAASS